VPATQKPIYVEQGATFTLPFTWYYAGPTVNGKVTVGPPRDLSGWRARMEISKQPGSSALVSASSEGPSPAITLGGAAGTIAIKISPTDTRKLNIETCYYDLQLRSPAGDIYRLLQGKCVVSLAVTRTSP